MTNSVKKSGRGREILIVSHYYDTHGGGIERAVRRLIEELAGKTFHFTWAASEDARGFAKNFKSGTNKPLSPPADASETADSDADPAEAPAHTTFLPMKSCNLLERLCGVPWPVWGPGSLRRLRSAVRQADAVWLHDAPYMGNIAAFWMARRAKKPVVITQHIGTVPYRNPVLRGLMRMADRIFTRRMLRLAQQTVFVSDWIAETYYRQRIFKTPVMIVPNGVDPDIFYPIPAEQRWKLRGRFALRDDQPVLLFVGRFIEKKGLSAIERLARLLPDWRFWLAGQGPIDPERWYQPNVHVFRDREGESLAELYRAADLLILPSFGEGFPLVVQEAMACGLPVICSPATAGGSLLAKPFLLTAAVDPASPEHTAKVWAARLKRQREFLPLSQANENLANAAHHFWSWPKIARCYADIFNGFSRQRNS